MSASWISCNLNSLFESLYILSERFLKTGNCSPLVPTIASAIGIVHSLFLINTSVNESKNQSFRLRIAGFLNAPEWIREAAGVLTCLLFIV